METEAEDASSLLRDPRTSALQAPPPISTTAGGAAARGISEPLSERVTGKRPAETASSVAEPGTGGVDNGEVNNGASQAETGNAQSQLNSCKSIFLGLGHRADADRDGEGRQSRSRLRAGMAQGLGRPAKAPRLDGGASTAVEPAEAAGSPGPAGVSTICRANDRVVSTDGMSVVAGDLARHNQLAMGVADARSRANSGDVEHANVGRPFKITRYSDGRLSSAEAGGTSSAGAAARGKRPARKGAETSGTGNVRATGADASGAGGPATSSRVIGAPAASSAGGPTVGTSMSAINGVGDEAMELVDRLAAAAPGNSPVNQDSNRRAGSIYNHPRGGSVQARDGGDDRGACESFDSGLDSGRARAGIRAGPTGTSHSAESGGVRKRVRLGVDYASVPARGRGGSSGRSRDRAKRSTRRGCSEDARSGTAANERGEATGGASAGNAASASGGAEGSKPRTRHRSKRTADKDAAGSDDRGGSTRSRSKHRRRERDGSREQEGGANDDNALSPRAEDLTSEDFQCNICWELLARPVTLACGHTACESCMAKYLRAQAQAQAQIGNLRANRMSCPAGCQRMIPLVLPQVTTMVQKLLTRGFPRLYSERLREAQSDVALVAQVRRVAEDAASDARRRRRRHHHGVAAGGGGFGGAGGMEGFIGGLEGGGREVLGFGNVPPGFMQGLRGQQNAARFRLDVAVPQREIPPHLAKWCKRLGLALFACLCASWHHRVFHAKTEPWIDPKAVTKADADPALAILEGISTRFDEAFESRDSEGACSGDSGGDYVGEDRIDGECSALDGERGGVQGQGPAAGQNKPWLFGLELNTQEFIAQNRWTALRSFYPSNTSPWNSVLFLYISDPVLENAPSAEKSSHRTPKETIQELEVPSAAWSWKSMLLPPTVRVTADLMSWSILDVFLTLESWLSGKAAQKGAVPEDADTSENRVTLEDLEDTGSRKAGEERQKELGDKDEAWANSQWTPPATPDTQSSQENERGNSDGTSDTDKSGGKQAPRRLFLEFFGPIVAFFSWLGFRQSAAELLTLGATQLCPLLAVAPLLRLGTHVVGYGGSADDLVSMDFSLDLVIFAVFRLTVITAAFWLSTWKLLRRDPLRRTIPHIAQVACLNLCREFAIVKVVFPAIEHLLFHYVLQWQSRYLVTWALISFRIFILRMLAILRMATLVATPFIARPTLEAVETCWCHLFTYLLLGPRFFNALFAGGEPGRHQLGARRNARQWARAIRAARRWARAMRNAGVGPQVPPANPVGNAIAQAAAVMIAPGINDRNIAHFAGGANHMGGIIQDLNVAQAANAAVNMGRGAGVMGEGIQGGENHEAPIAAQNGAGDPLNAPQVAQENAPLALRQGHGGHAVGNNRNEIGGVGAWARGDIPVRGDQGAQVREAAAEAERVAAVLRNAIGRPAAADAAPGPAGVEERFRGLLQRFRRGGRGFEAAGGGVAGIPPQQGVPPQIVVPLQNQPGVLPQVGMLPQQLALPQQQGPPQVDDGVGFVGPEAAVGAAAIRHDIAAVAERLEAFVRLGEVVGANLGGGAGPGGAGGVAPVVDARVLQAANEEAVRAGVRERIGDARVGGREALLLALANVGRERGGAAGGDDDARGGGHEDGRG